MGLSDKTTASIQRAISDEAEALLSGADRQAKSVVAIKEQQERIKEMKVREGHVWWEVDAGWRLWGAGWG
jgi:hypothetical protein